MTIKEQSRVAAALDKLDTQGIETAIHIGTLAGTLRRKGKESEADAVRQMYETISAAYRRSIDELENLLSKNTPPSYNTLVGVNPYHEMYKALKKRNQALSNLLSETSQKYPSLGSLPDVAPTQEKREQSQGDLGHAIVKAFGRDLPGNTLPDAKEQERIASRCMEAFEKYGLSGNSTNVSIPGNPAKQRLNSR
ncbi:MAG TPA: hypothetical protein VFV38_33075 [Ktedonobacteraceae bacterium]|nr:hypothetical protein [Ktedonobacteraceae bacterium]